MWGDIEDIFLFGCPKTIDITGFFKKFCIATRTTPSVLRPREFAFNLTNLRVCSASTNVFFTFKASVKKAF